MRCRENVPVLWWMFLTFCSSCPVMWPCVRLRTHLLFQVPSWVWLTTHVIWLRWSSWQMPSVRAERVRQEMPCPGWKSGTKQHIRNLWGWETIFSRVSRSSQDIWWPKLDRLGGSCPESQLSMPLSLTDCLHPALGCCAWWQSDLNTMSGITTENPKPPAHLRKSKKVSFLP